MRSSAAPRAARAPVAAARASIVRGRYIAGPLYDWLFFILSPLLALALGWLVIALRLDEQHFTSQDAAGRLQRIAIPALLSAAFTHGHLAIVFFRSHLNRQIFRLHPHRFVTVPIVLFLASLASLWVFVIASVVVVWWDVYHSSLQTFGLGRIYDQRAGNDVQVARRADFFFNLVIYSGPVLAGVNLWSHLRSFHKFQQVDSAVLSGLAEAVFARSTEVRWVVVVVGLTFTASYLLYYARLVRRGYVIPLPKLALYLTTAVVAITCWGFGSFGEAYLVMNFFHALQYFGIVWWSERKTITSRFRVSWPLGLLILLVVGLGYGLWRAHGPEPLMAVVALGNVISLMHFWYDGFVWSVRKGQV